MHIEEVNINLLIGHTWQVVERFHKQHTFFSEI